ncbi:MAG: hypothetical protein J6I79_09610 [Paludibacteraceae bacterium]|nr:hypothetical protein [Paludibacteraceae bacterium]
MYGKGFPSRWKYVEEKLKSINGQPELDKYIKSVFSPVNFVGGGEVLLSCLNEFNGYLRFDGWCVHVVKSEIEIHKVEKPDIEHELKQVLHCDEVSEDSFLKIEFDDVNVESLPLPEFVKPILNDRLEEEKKAFVSKAYLSSIIMVGSVLEAVLLGLAEKSPKRFYIYEIMGFKTRKRLL